ncbi:MAG: hypothetical protein [Olavius algarvensis Delta 4 endosymbiont]|nr:MAG: hypothetical protein [Olavius algarvensis Delta 4 endosymbiont]
MPDSSVYERNFERLRQQAEALLKERPDSVKAAPNEILELINELKVHQVELEIQNEELKRAQLELTELQHEYERLYEFAPCGYVTLNPKGITQRANLTSVKLLGRAMERILNIGFTQLIDPGYVDAFLEARRISGQEGQKQYVEVPLKTNKNPTVWIRADISAERADTGRVLQWSITLFDITEQKKAEEALQKMHAELRTRIVERTASLSKTNEALKTLLDLREIEKKSVEQVMLNNLRRYVFPYLDELDLHALDHNVSRLSRIVRHHIEHLIAPMSTSLSSVYADLTQREIKVADRVRQGESTKSIARSLYISISTVEKHRNNIRKKFGILNKKVNLHAYLKSLT